MREMAEERREVGSFPGQDPLHVLLKLGTETPSKAVKAFVLSKQQDAATRQRGIEETVSLCRRDPAITDLAALHRIQDSLKDLSLSAEEGTKLWDRAVAAKPGDKDLAMTWLNRSIVENNWPGAQKVC
jgi:N-terminal acetyltransferase B complex non-catalytic subunit